MRFTITPVELAEDTKVCVESTGLVRGYTTPSRLLTFLSSFIAVLVDGKLPPELVEDLVPAGTAMDFVPSAATFLMDGTIDTDNPAVDALFLKRFRKSGETTFGGPIYTTDGLTTGPRLIMQPLIGAALPARWEMQIEGLDLSDGVLALTEEGENLESPDLGVWVLGGLFGPPPVEATGEFTIEARPLSESGYVPGQEITVEDSFTGDRTGIFDTNYVWRELALLEEGRLRQSNLPDLPEYADNAAADAAPDGTLPSGGLYTLTGSRAVYRKP